MRLVYFASVRERIGRGSEERAVPASVVNVADLLDWLRGEGDEYSAALGPQAAVRVALDRVHALPATLLGSATEAAFFPPMTGG